MLANNLDSDSGGVDDQMKEPIVSIVTPARAAARTLERTFASVARQNLEDWEHIVVTYPADTETEQVAIRNAARDPRIIVKSASKETAGAARNAGFESARGQFVLFLDADDTITPGHLQRMVREAVRAGADVLISGYRRVDGEGAVIQRRPEHTGTLEIGRILQGPPTALHSMLFRRGVLEQIGCFDAALRTNEDWDLCLRALETDARFHACGGDSAEYWITPDSLSSDGAAMIRDRRQVAQRAGKLKLAGKAEAWCPDLAQDGLNTALWAGAIAIARNRDTAVLASMASDGLPPAPVSLSVKEGAAALLDGLMVGFGCAARGIEARMATRWEALEAYAGALAEVFGDTGFDEALLAEFEFELARIGPAGRRRFVGRTFVVPAGLHLHRAMDVPAGARQAVVRVPLVRPRSLATVAFAPAVARGRNAAWLLAGRSAAWLMERPCSPGGKLSLIRDQAVHLGVLAWRKAALRFRPVQKGEREIDPEVAGDWEGIFSKENPWGYDSLYEQGKYERTLSLLGDRPVGRALELACAEGHFTEHLANRAAHVTAADISPTALARCRERCARRNLANVDFLQLDFFREHIGHGWDLIVSSEVLYYMASRDELARYAARVVEALNEGGYFLHAHPYQLSDSRERSAFDWGDPFGARTIAETFAGTPELVLEAAVETELYRCELYRKCEIAARRTVPAEPVPQSIRSELDPELSGKVVWDGAVVTREEAEAERRYRVPVLMYHSISDTGPGALRPWRTTPEEFEHQLRFLRRRGYRSLPLDEWDRARTCGGALSGRPVILTFDDGFEDFAEHAWPILKRNGFEALAFVVSGLVGATSEWDRWYGQPSRLMDWECLADLVSQGLAIGSHCHEHRALDRMTCAEIETQALLSRDTITRRLGVVPRTVAPPFGICRPHHAEVLQRAGFERVFLAGGDQAPVFGPRLRTPRIDVPGGAPIKHFAELVGAVEPPEHADLP